MYLVCDHDPPGSKTYLIVAQVINDMKSDHTRTEFWRNVKELASVLATGSPDHARADQARAYFLAGSGGIKHWRR
ncbi:MAG TPA: hypothetical protein DEA08_39170 [Planctomycetes bacterium]|nr:hypothetical protein [Planctomycetota bacterium]|tara:strand:+ start:1731 stop:1955 length:225 start_codon:yes stop_codon:yes gene_type:complete